jgi:hypothetical protein
LKGKKAAKKEGTEDEEESGVQVKTRKSVTKRKTSKDDEDDEESDSENKKVRSIKKPARAASKQEK